MAEEKPKQDRIQIIDALRGLSVILMVCHHLLYNLVAFMGAPGWFFRNPVFDVLHPIFAGLFILLSGVSSRFSRSNIKRGFKTAGCALLVTAATYYIGLPIWFGILHLLSFCMLFYGCLRKLVDIFPFWVYIILLALSVLADRLDLFAFITLNIYSADWFPPIPWIFVFLTGTGLGELIRTNKFPDWFYRYDVPVLPSIGRRSLLIYMTHQPILYGIVILAIRLGS